MPVPEGRPGSVKTLVTDHLPLARGISTRMKRRYGWVATDELYSYALLGLTMAADAFDPARNVPFANFAAQKAMFWAIDEMRKDGLLRRRDAKPRPRMVPLSTLIGRELPFDGMPDDRADRVRDRIEARDLCAVLLRRLSDTNRRLILMYYADHLTFKEIAKAMRISESCVCLRHAAVIQKLRRLVHTQGMA